MSPTARFPHSPHNLPTPRPLFPQERNTSDKERLFLIEVLAPFTYFSCSQMPPILDCFVMGSEVRAVAGKQQAVRYA